MPEINLPNGYYDIPPGKLINIATSLHMLALPRRALAVLPESCSLERVDASDLATYRSVFRAVGQDLMWFSRLLMSDEKLRAILSNPKVDSNYLVVHGARAGLLELDATESDVCELAFFGLAPAVIGKGLGRALMDEGLRRAWSKPISKLWVHTCTFDHPAALPFYIRSGFVPFRRQIEFHDDPRLTGHMPLSACPQVPVLT
jgi:ribosomal protein S18 acetylase RimI-like enzyme